MMMELLVQEKSEVDNGGATWHRHQQFDDRRRERSATECGMSLRGWLGSKAD